LTQADKKADEIIEDGLDQLLISPTVLSEEGKNILYKDRKYWDYF